MKKYNDTDLRKALERTEAKRRPAEVPDDFLANVLDEIESEAKPKTIKLWRWVAAAACIAIVVGLGAIIALNRQTTPQPAVAIIADTASSIDQTPSQTAIAETEIAPEPVAAPEPKPEPAPAKPKRQHKKAQPKPAPDNQQQVAETITQDKDPDYVSPELLDALISKMADNQKAAKRVLDCGHEHDSTTTEMVYLFPKNSGDIMGRLLMSAAHYNENTDGYFLNYSQQQFFFTLNDEHTGKNYLWIAEKTDDGRIMLYSFQSPIGSELGSECYHDYHNKLLYNNMNTITNI